MKESRKSLQKNKTQKKYHYTLAYYKKVVLERGRGFGVRASGTRMVVCGGPPPLVLPLLTQVHTEKKKKNQSESLLGLWG